VTAAVIAGPSAGVTGGASQNSWPAALVRDHPGLIKSVTQSGRHQRAGHDRERWRTIRWSDYRAHVGICQQRGPWRVEMVEDKADAPTQWIAEAEGLPWEPGWYTALVHADRGLVMSDVPAEIAGCLPFLDRVRRERCSSVLISGLGLGIVPAWLLANCPVERIDVIEIDPDVIELTTRDEAAREMWAADPRLHVHLGDALTVRLGDRCVLHEDCYPPEWFAAGWHDIWDRPSAENLPSMARLHRRFGRRTGWQLSWERPECEAMRRRGRRDGFGCTIREDTLS
jgi:hypothetical protein